jgi:hypothetical protein
MKRLQIGLIACSSWALALVPGATRAATIKIVALQNEESPEASFFYKKFDNPRISDATGERLAVYTRLGGGKQCIFSLDPDTASGSTIVCRRDPTPDGHSFTRLGAKVGGLSINMTGTLGWAARVSSGRSGVFRTGPATVASTGDPVPLPGVGLLKTFSYARISNTGDVVFMATISGGAVVLGVEVNQGIFRCSGGDGDCSTGTGTLTAVALVNDAVPDKPGRKYCKFLDLDGGSYGVSFRANTKLDCANTSEVQAVGLFRQPVAGSAVTVGLEGEPCRPFPGPGGTTYFRISGPPSIADTGMVAFEAHTAGLVANSILYLCDPATCPTSPATDEVTQGQLDDDGNLFRTFAAPAVSDLGEIAFRSSVSTPDSKQESALYIRHANADIETVARSNLPVPGASPPGVWDDISPPAMSPGGKVAFGARIERTINPRRLRGIFVFE